MTKYTNYLRFQSVLLRITICLHWHFNRKNIFFAVFYSKQIIILTRFVHHSCRFNGDGGQVSLNLSCYLRFFFSAAITDRTICDHLRAPELFKASINATGEHHHMTAYKCRNFEKFKVICCYIIFYVLYLFCI